MDLHSLVKFSSGCWKQQLHKLGIDCHNKSDVWSTQLCNIRKLGLIEWFLISWLTIHFSFSFFKGTDLYIWVYLAISKRTYLTFLDRTAKIIDASSFFPLFPSIIFLFMLLLKGLSQKYLAASSKKITFSVIFRHCPVNSSLVHSVFLSI